MVCLLLCTQCTGDPKQETTVDTTQETFETFFGQFSRDSVFQRERIAFPLTIHVWEIDDTQIEQIIQKQDWEFEDFSKDAAAAKRETDAFAVQYRKQPPFRIYQRQGIDNGIQIAYYFEQKEGKWYLVKIEDKST